MTKQRIYIIISLVITIFILPIRGQQIQIDNKSFNEGETLLYDLYFRYGLINVKAGISSIKTSNIKYNNKSSYKIDLSAKSTGIFNNIFALKDTLTGFTTIAMKPLLFIKHAHEGSENIIEQITYQYNKDNVQLNTKRIKNGKIYFNKNLYLKQSNLYDLVSVVLYARNVDYKTLKNNQKNINFISGTRIYKMIIRYIGTTVVKANDRKNYQCMVLVLSIPQGDKDAFENCQEAMRIYITNDNERIPIKLKSKLRIGYTEAIFKGTGK